MEKKYFNHIPSRHHHALVLYLCMFMYVRVCVFYDYEHKVPKIIQDHAI